jgi:hypothetical protein
VTANEINLIDYFTTNIPCNNKTNSTMSGMSYDEVRRTAKEAARDVVRDNQPSLLEGIFKDLVFSERVRGIARTEINDQLKSERGEITSKISSEIRSQVPIQVRAELYSAVNNEGHIKSSIKEEADKLRRDVDAECALIRRDAFGRIGGVKDEVDRNLSEAMGSAHETAQRAAHSFAEQFTRSDENNILFRGIQDRYATDAARLVQESDQKIRQLEQRLISNDAVRDQRLKEAEHRAQSSQSWAMASLGVAVATGAAMIGVLVSQSGTR